MSIFLSVCLSVPKDIANQWTEMVLLYKVIGPKKVYNYFGGGYKKSPLEKITLHPLSYRIKNL